MVPTREQPSYQAVLALVGVAGLLRKAADRFFKGFGLTQSQFNVLMVLRHDTPEGCSQTELSERLLIKGANTTVLVRRLETERLVVRETDPADERAKIVRITAKGRKLLERVEPLYYRRVTALMENQSPASLKRFINTLNATQRAIEALEGT